MHAAGYVGRVGGLAVALGIGAVVTIGGAGLAAAAPADSSSASEGDSAAPRGSAARSAGRDDTTPRRRGSTAPAAVPSAKPKQNKPNDAAPEPAAAVSVPKPTAPRASASVDQAPAVLAPAQPVAEVSVPRAAANSPAPVAKPLYLAAVAPALTPVSAPAMVATPTPAAARGTLASVLAPLLGSGGGAPVQSSVSWVMLAAARRDWELPRPQVPRAATVAPAATNNPPVISGVALSAPAAGNGAVTGTVTASDADKDKLSFKAVTSAKGAVSITQPTLASKGGVFTYTPTAAARHAAAKVGATTAVSTDTVTVTVTDSKGAAVSRAVVVPISPLNAVPTATKTVGTPNAAGVVTGTVTGGDADKDALTYTAPASTAKGAVALTAAGAFTYTPTAAARHAAAKLSAAAGDKSDMFTVTIADGYGGKLAVPVAVAISPSNAAPDATVSIGKPDPVSGVAKGKVTATDADKDSLTYSASKPAKGALALGSDGSFSYTPTADARSAARISTTPVTDTFTVTVADGYGGTKAVNVTATVAPSNSAPVAGSPTGTWDPNTGVVTGSVNAADPDNDPLTYTAGTISTAKGGKVVVTSTGGLTYTPTAVARHAAARIGAPSADLTDSVSVVVTDKYGAIASLPLSINIAPANAAPVADVAVAKPDPLTGVAKGKVTASDADNDALTYTVSTPAKGAVTVAADGSFSYTPTSAARTAARNSSAPTTDTFTITVADGYGGSKALNLVTAVIPTNSAPVAGNPMGTADLNTGIVTGSVNAVDPDGDPLTYTAVTITTAKGKLVVTNTGGLTYTPTAMARHAAARVGAPTTDLTDSVSVVATDKYGASTMLPLSVEIIPSNATPVAGSTVVGAPNASTGAVTGTVKVTDADKDTLVFSGSTTTANGTVVVNANGTFTYTPTAAARRNAAKDRYSVVANVAGLTQPDFVTVSPNGKNLYIWDSGSLKVIDTGTNSVTGYVPVPYPTAVAFSPDSSKIYVTSYNNGTMSVVDAATNTVTATISGLNVPSRVTISPDGARAYVADEGGALRMVDLKTNTASVVIADLYPSKVAVSQDTTRAYAANLRTETLSVIDLASKTVIATIPGIGQVSDIEVSRDGKRVYIAQRSLGAGGSVSVIDASTKVIVATVSLPGGMPGDIALSPDGTRAYVTQVDEFGPGSMSVIDLVTHTFVAKTPELWSPTSIAVMPDGARAYVSQSTTDGLVVVNLAPTDSFSVKVADGYGGTLTIPVTVPISPTNMAPVVGVPTVGTPNASTGVVTGTLRATDADKDVLNFGGTTSTAKGSVVVSSDGSFTYTPTAAARRAAYLPGAPSASKSDVFSLTVSDGYGGWTAIPITVTVSPALTYVEAGDVRRDPDTGRIAIRTTFSENTTQPGTDTPGWLNWLIGGSSGARNGFPADVAGWQDLYLVGTTTMPSPYDPTKKLPANSVLRNPANGAVAIRTSFPEDQGDNLANMAWLILTTSQGGLYVSTPSLKGWDILYVAPS